MLPAPSSTRSARARKSSSAALRSNRSTSTTASRTRSPSRSSARPASWLHTGDFKIDYTPLSGDAVTDLSTIAEYGRRGVLALLADSTNAERPGFTATEQTVAEGVRSLFARAKNRRIIVATFASNIYRVQQIIELAMESGRKVAVSGRAWSPNTEMARELGYIRVPDNVLIDVEEVNKYPPEKVVLITTGSQ